MVVPKGSDAMADLKVIGTQFPMGMAPTCIFDILMPFSLSLTLLLVLQTMTQVYGLLNIFPLVSCLPKQFLKMLEGLSIPILSVLQIWVALQCHVQF